MAMSQNILPTEEKKHELCAVSREHITMTGVKEVVSVSDVLAALVTSEGRLYIRGAELTLGMLNVDTGELTLDGRINSIEYRDKKKSKSSAASKLFG